MTPARVATADGRCSGRISGITEENERNREDGTVTRFSEILRESENPRISEAPHTRVTVRLKADTTYDWG